MKFKTLIVDSEWLLKRNYMKRSDMFSKGEHCGGSYGYLESLRKVINYIMPDRVVSMWDGMNSGIMRYNIYEQYKGNRKKSWDENAYFSNQQEIDEEARRKYSILVQKIKVKNYLEELFVRQLEVDEIEADDLIAEYVNTKDDNEEIVIYSSDKDYLQLVKKDVSILRPTKTGLELITIDNFREKFGFIQENILLLRCFEGDDSDQISGVDGIAEKTILKNFPKFSDEIYTIDRIIEESVELYNKKKKNKTLEKIIGSRRTHKRNKQLMCLSPVEFITQEGREQIKELRETTLIGGEGIEKRSISEAMKMMMRDGYNTLVYRNDLTAFLQPFYRLVNKEKEFSEYLKNNN